MNEDTPGGAELLNEWLASQRRTDFAEHLGISLPYLSQLAHGHRVPSLPLAIRIERATGGAVPCRAWGQIERRPQ